jgi:ribosomal-protein-alanine N-acetyltransferase
MMISRFSTVPVPTGFYSKKLSVNDNFPMREISPSYTREKTTAVLAVHDLRPMTSGDLRAVIEVENVSNRSPWSEASFRAELGNPFSTVNILRLEGEVAGYICYHMLFEELNILNLVTSPSFRRQGVARLLLEGAINDALAHKANMAFLEVRAGNLAAISLYASCGFQCSSRRKNYYSDGEDALVMKKNLMSKQI